MADAIDRILARLGTLLRYVAPGFVLLGLLMWADVSFLKFPDVEAGSKGKAALLFAALAGITIYTFHVNTILQVAWRVIMTCRIKDAVRVVDVKVQSGKGLYVWFVAAGEVIKEISLQRWQRRGTSDTNVKAIQHELNTWGAMLNFMYCVSIGIVIALAAGWGTWTKVNIILLIVGAAVAFVTAVISHIRFISHELLVIGRFPMETQNAKREYGVEPPLSTGS